MKISKFALAKKDSKEKNFVFIPVYPVRPLFLTGFCPKRGSRLNVHRTGEVPFY